MSGSDGSVRLGIMPPTSESGGGIFQYAQTMLNVLSGLEQERPEEFVVIGNGLDPSLPLLAGADLRILPLLPQGLSGRVYERLARIARLHLPRGQRERLMNAVAERRQRRIDFEASPIHRADIDSWLRASGIDFIVYPSPAPLSFEIEVPYAFTVHDLQHRIHPEFPEVSAEGEYEAREHLFRHGIGRARIVIVDSEIGKEDVLEYYGELIEPERIFVLPFLASESCRRSVSAADRRRVGSSYGLPERYLFYPAQLWPHKNHEMLVRALGMLRRSEGLEIPLVLVGSTIGKIRAETWRRVRALALDLGVEGAIKHLGYVPDEDMAPLYARATALTMPTWFGPTNIPVLEAWAQECPVLTSDIRGVREQVGDAGVLADPSSAEDLADGIRRLWLDAGLRAELVERGKRRFAAYTRQDYATALSRILDQATSFVVAQPE